MNIRAIGGHEYFITLTDDYSRFGYVYLMQRKSESFDKFKEFRAEVEKQTGKYVKALRSDRGGEYLSGDFIGYLREHGILSQLTAPGTPQQNGVSERRNRTLLDMVRSMLSYADLPITFWGHALLTAAYILNHVPSKSVPLTPRELWAGRKPTLRHFRIWGCPAHVRRDKGNKMEARSKVCLFIGYPKETKGYLFYDPKEKKVLVSTNVVFLETDYMMDHRPPSKVILDELSDTIDKDIASRDVVGGSPGLLTDTLVKPFWSIQSLRRVIPDPTMRQWSLLTATLGDRPWRLSFSRCPITQSGILKHHIPILSQLGVSGCTRRKEVQMVLLRLIKRD
jgi:hypothetical protein